MHTIKAITDTAKQRILHSRLGKDMETLAQETHEALCQDLLHASMHGDVSLCQDICVKMGFGQDYTPAKAAVMKEWLFQFSGKQIVVRTDPRTKEKIWGLVKGWSAENFKLEEAQNTPYWTLFKDEIPKKFSLAQIIKMIEGLPRRVENNVTNETFIGDSTAAVEFSNELVDFVKARKAKYSKDQTGETELEADALLAKARRGTRVTDTSTEVKQEAVA